MKSSDFDVLEALKDDIANSKSSSNNVRQSFQTNMPLKPPGELNDPNKPKDADTEGQLQSSSPPGSYSQELPQKTLLSEIGNEKSPTPPLLPPQLLQVFSIFFNCISIIKLILGHFKQRNWRAL